MIFYFLILIFETSLIQALILKPTRIQIETKPLPSPTTRQNREFLGVKMMLLFMSLSMKYSSISSVWSAASISSVWSAAKKTKTVWCAAYPPSKLRRLSLDAFRFFFKQSDKEGGVHDNNS